MTTFVFTGDTGGREDGALIHPSARIGGDPEDRVFKRSGQVSVPPWIDRSAEIEAYVTIDAGVVRPTRVGARSWLLKHSHVGHDAQVGDDVVLSTGAIVGGYAVVENGVKIGLNAVILPFRKVGAGARVGAGAVVTRNVPPGVTVIGVPARRLEDWERNEKVFSERGDEHARDD